MSKIKIPAGTRIYLTKNIYSFNIQPGHLFLNDNLYVAYDVKINGVVIIPKNTRVVGDWITEFHPSIVAQLQLSRIFLYGSGQPISADSNVIEAVKKNDSSDNTTNNIRLLTNRCKNKNRSALSNTVKFSCNLQKIPNGTIHIQIFTNEIPVIITKDIYVVVNL